MVFMVNIVKRTGILLTLCLLFTGMAKAQVSQAGRITERSPLSLPALPENVTISLPTIDRQILLQEDQRESAEGLPFRFGVSFEVAYSIENSGSWTTLPTGERLWRLKIVCPGAISVNLIFDRFHLPEGAEFYVFDETAQFVLGAFTSRNNKEHGKFATAPVPGESCVLEYYEPSGVAYPGEISLGKIIHGYRDVFAMAKDAQDFGESGPCNINVKCPEGADWANERRAVAMIITDGGQRLCTGALINNARMDMTPYLLTANHCLGEEETWVLMFGYESHDCENNEGPLTNTISGATLIANDEYTDFGLVQLQENPPDSYGVYFAGWSALDSPADSSVCIHHPSGDIKKISFDYDPLISGSYFDLEEDDTSHWKIEAWEIGTTERGSSGAPLFDYDHRIVGQLHGGLAACDLLAPDWFGRFSISWDLRDDPSKHLSDWLDPDSIGLQFLDGRDGTGITIYHNPILRSNNTTNDYKITAIIVSNCGLNTDCLNLSYQINGVSDTSMMEATGQSDEYTGTIPPQPAGTTILYSLSACDTCSQTASSDIFQLNVWRPLCGDINGNEIITLLDITRLIDHVFISKRPLAFPEVANIDGSVDGLITLSDILHLIAYVYEEGELPACDYTEQQ